MEPLPIARYIPQKSKKRVFPGSSSSYMDPEVVEISPPIAQSSKSKSLKQKEVVLHEVIDIDMDEDSVDVMLIDDKIDTKNKGKETLAGFSNGHSSSANRGSVDGVQSYKNCAFGSHDSINVDGYGPDFISCDDDYLDMYYDDLIDDDYAMLQAHFDSIDIPPGVEAPIPWLSNPTQNKNQPVFASSLTSSSLQVQPDAVMFPSGTSSSRPWGVPESAKTKKKSCSINSLRAEIRTELSPSRSLSEFAKKKKRLAASICSTHLSSQTQKGSVNTIPPESDSGKSWCFTESSRSKKKFAVSGSNSTTRHSLPNQLSTIKLAHGYEQPSGGSYFPNSLSLQVGNGNLTQSSILPIHTTGVDASNSWWQQSPVFPDLSSLYSPSNDVHIFPGVDLYTPWVQDPATAAGSSTLPSETVTGNQNHGNASDILKKFQDFKRFDTVEDHSDHHYSRNGSSLKQPSKNWAKKIQEEWKILEKDLPDTIFVRVYESRMDLLRAVIVGAEGTPYHDGLFFFDVSFPSGYPNVPPLVHYHSGGLRINPNLYNCGKVCLSLLNTWTGDQNEKWIPGVSTMLQVLVSVQGLILNAKPFFNEPGYARMSGSARGELSSQQYNENTFILSLKTMVYTMRRPPKYFEDFVVGHFHRHAHDILIACRAYTDGAQVGCLAKGGVQDVDAGDKSCSQNFKENLARHINMLVQAFTQIGLADCEKFISPVGKGNGPALPAPSAANGHLSL